MSASKFRWLFWYQILILQAPDDFPARIKVGDRILKSFYTLTGQYRKAEMTGALFAVVAKKDDYLSRYRK